MSDVLRRLDRIQRKTDRLLAFAQPRPSLQAAPTARPTDPRFDVLGYMRARWAYHEPHRPPTHLLPAITPIEELLGPHQGQRFFWLSVPPRHWKTVTLNYVAAAHMELRPGDSVAWCSCESGLAEEQSIEIKRILRGAGVGISEELDTRADWRNVGGGKFCARGVGGSIVGRGFRLIIVDDPVKNEKISRSQSQLNDIYRWLETDVWTRLTPDGVGILVHTRWTPNDPIGRYRLGEGTGVWDGVNIPALCAPTKDEPVDPLDREVDDPILPDIWTKEHLLSIAAKNPTKFSGLYQGRPVRPGNAVFNADPPRYTNLPDGDSRTAHGVDLAYSAKSSSDWSVCLTGREYLDRRGRIYITGCQRKQVLAPAFTLVLHSVQAKRYGPMVWHVAGTEKGNADFIAQKVRGFKAVPASADKLTRSTPAYEKWNNLEIVLPSEDSPYYGEWVEDLLSEVMVFTGVNDASDDQVDALGSLVAAFGTSSDGETVSFGAYRFGSSAGYDDWDD